LRARLARHVWSLVLPLVALIMSGCNPTTSNAPISAGTEPYNIKVSDLLRVRLGTSLDDFLSVQGRKAKSKRVVLPDTCTQGPDDDVFCMLFPDPLTQPAIGEAKVYSYMVSFYEKQVIEVEYGLVGVDWEPLLNSLKEKFGEPSTHESKVWTWENSVSRLSFRISESDFSSSHLTLTLSKQLSELVKRRRVRAKEQTNRDL